MRRAQASIKTSYLSSAVAASEADMLRLQSCVPVLALGAVAEVLDLCNELSQASSSA